MEDVGVPADETLYEDFTEVDIEGVMVDTGVSFELALIYGVIEPTEVDEPLEDDVVVINGVFVLAEDVVKSGETLCVDDSCEVNVGMKDRKEDEVMLGDDDDDKE